MKLPKYFTTVTPFSKLIVLIIFISFPIYGFLLGLNFQQKFSPQIRYIQEEKIVKVYPTESPKSLIYRCGDYPSEIDIKADHYSVISGPFWSPDCRHIAWAVWESGTSSISQDEGIKYSGPYQQEGLFLYDDRKGLTKKIYTPSKEESITLKEWKDKDTIIFSKGVNKIDSLDITSDQMRG